jgi:DNA polymerase V
MPIEEIWGIGWKLAPKLKAEGISTALALSHMRPQHAQQLMGIHGRQMVSELNGTACYGLTPEHDLAKSILRSRTFGEDTNQMHVLEAAIATLGSQAAYKLRREGLLARRIGIFTSTNRHKPGHRSWTRELALAMPTNDSGHIISALANELESFFSDKQYYHQLGVFMHDFIPQQALQTDLLGNVDPRDHDKAQARMQALDSVNKKWGRGKLRYAAENLSNSWRPKHHTRSPNYVSSWDELPIARIKP